MEKLQETYTAIVKRMEQINYRLQVSFEATLRRR